MVLMGNLPGPGPCRTCRRSCWTWTARWSTRTRRSSAPGGPGRPSTPWTRAAAADRARAARAGQRAPAPAGPVRGEAAAAARYQLELEYVDVADITAAPGAPELLAELDRLGLPWAVVTSADPPLARTRLAAAGRPALLVTIDDVRAGKPDPEGYLLAARKLGADPRRCLVVEDAEAGVAAGRAAGAVVAGLRGVDADIQITDLHQLTELLGQAGNPRA